MSNAEAANYVVKGNRLERPNECPDDVYALMLSCWQEDPENRPSFLSIVEFLGNLLPRIADTLEKTVERSSYQDEANNYILSNTLDCKVSYENSSKLVNR